MRAWAMFVFAAAALAAEGIPKFDLAPGPLELSGPAQAHRFIHAVGERAGLWGFENGRLEAWVYPLKIFRDFHLSFQLEGSPAIYRGDGTARNVRVYPHMVRLRYAAEAFAVTETLFTPREEPGAVILLEVEAPAAMRVYVRFRPELSLMWPGALGGQSSTWEADRKWIRLADSSGRFSALIGSPAAIGSNALGYRPYLTDAAPYDELELSVSVEEAKRSFIPVVISAGIRGHYDDAATYERLLKNLPALYTAARRHWGDLESRGTEFVTPDAAVNEAMRWSRVSLEQLKICNPALGCSYVSGYGSSGTGTRPMYAWFFDEPVISAWAQLAYGDKEAVKLAFRFLRKYQREDGKTMHEVAQSAAYLDWFKDYPYAYIHPDSPLWYVIAHGNYYRFTGDADFAREIWPSVRKAYDYCLSVLDPEDELLKIPAGDWGSMETAAFTKDAAMAGEWIAALQAMRELSLFMKDTKLARECEERARKAAESLERKFWNPELNYYNYGVDLEGRPVTHLNPVIGYAAWFGSLPDERARAVLERLSTAVFLSDWGQRNMPLDDPRYKEGDYQIGSAWPFLTAGPLLAQYRYRNAVEGFLTWTSMLRLRQMNARGAMPEALSGHVYRLLDRGVPHQMFSEHVAIPVLVYGILGVDVDAPARSLGWAPQMPPGWPSAALRRFPFGGPHLNLELRNTKGEMTGLLESSSTEPVTVSFAPALPAGSKVASVLLDGKPLEFRTVEHAADLQALAAFTLRGHSSVTVRYEPGVAVEVDWQPLLEGDTSRNLRVLRCLYRDRRLEMVVEGRPERIYTARLYTPWRVSTATGARVAGARDGIVRLELEAPEEARRKIDRAGYVRWKVSVAFP